MASLSGWSNGNGSSCGGSGIVHELDCSDFGQSCCLEMNSPVSVKVI